MKRERATGIEMSESTVGTGEAGDELTDASAGLPKTTNWWGAFVIGLAGTILVTGSG